MTFEQFKLHPRVGAGVKAAGYILPTPIQEQAIPAALEGRDILGLAQTGTGKTAAFVLPLLHRLLDGPRGRIRALIVAPTRELAEQIHGEINTLGRGTDLRSATVYGGVGMTPQIRALRGGAEIIVACPGRLLDHLEQGNGKLSSLEVLVLDEADHMFDMGFLPAIRAIMKRVPAGAQRLLFSATMPSDLRHLAGSILKDPVTVEIGRAAPAETVAHALYPVGRGQKTAMLKHLLRKHDPRSVLVFTRTKHGAKRLAQQLDKDNFFVASLQGNLSQNKRQQALDGFRDGSYHILVATDIAARGIDVTRVSHVINYDVPTTPEAYTHRIGRTGRALRSGEAFTFVTQEDEKIVHAIERSLGARLERVKVEDFVYEADTAPSGGARPYGARPPGSGRNGDREHSSNRSSNQAGQAYGSGGRRPGGRGGPGTANRRAARPKR
jgi:ATP-dependent RNA helicase RhlE